MNEPVGSLGEGFERELRALLDRFGIESMGPDFDDAGGQEQFRFRITPEAADDPAFLTALLQFLLTWSASLANEFDRQTTRLRKLEADRD